MSLEEHIAVLAFVVFLVALLAFIGIGYGAIAVVVWHDGNFVGRSLFVCGSVIVLAAAVLGVLNA
jgi:hypothetical protein